jgi:membrane protease YdiL (CAAX protease family)
VLCVCWPLGPLLRIKQLGVTVIKPLFAPCTLWDLALISLLAGFGEEMLFRGVLQAAFVDWLGTWPGVLAASVVFGLLHLLTPTYGVLAGLMGAYLGAVWLATDNLLTAITAHAVYDFLALVVVVRGLTPGFPAGGPQIVDRS